MKNRFIFVCLITLAMLFLLGCDPVTYNLMLEISPSKTGAVLGEGEYQEGQEIELIAEAEDEYEFEKWTISGVTVSEDERFVYVMPNKDATVTANFVEKKYTLTLKGSPGEGGTVEGTGEYEEGAEIEIAAQTEKKYDFANWTTQGVEISESESFTFTMPSEDVTITANFMEIMYSVEKFRESTAPEWTISKTGDGFFRVEEGWLVLENHEEHGFATTAYANEYFKSFVLEVESRWLSGSEKNFHGVHTRAYIPEDEDDEYNAYVFLISPSGRFVVFAEIGDEIEILASGNSKFINREMEKSNHIKVVCIGDNLSFYVNGELLAELTNDWFLGGDVGFRLSTTDNEAKVGFRELMIKKP